MGEESGAKIRCNSTGFATGEVHFSGEWHLVFVGLAPATQLMVGLLLLVPKQQFTCAETKTLALEGALLAKITKLGVTDIGQLGGLLNCAPVVKPELAEYYNEGGAKVRAALKLRLAGGIGEPACLNWGSEMVLRFNRMLTIDL